MDFKLKNEIVRRFPDSVGARFKYAWQDERMWRERIVLVLLPVLLMTYMVTFWGPIEIITSNRNSLVFTIHDALLPLGIYFLSVTVAIVAIIGITFRGWFLDAIVSLIFSISIAAYAQGMFMNLDLGFLDGKTINWALYADWAIINLVIWGAAIAVILAMRYFHRAFWSGTVKYISAGLIAMQIVALVSILPSALGVESSGENTVSQMSTANYLSTNNEFLISNRSNTIIFVLDAFGQYMLTQTIDAFPDTMNNFHDFTRYDNYSTQMMGTFYGMSYLLTNEVYDPSKSYIDYLTNNWASSDAEAFYGALQDANYNCQVFSLPSDFCMDLQQMKGKVDNITNELEQVKSVNSNMLVRKMINISLLRYAPHALKPSFWTSDYDFYDIIEGDKYVTNDPEFYNRLKEKGLSIQNKQNSYIVYHLKGPHSPYTYNENVQFIEAGVERTQNARGSLFIVEEYLSQMKRLGVYDKSNIIVTADHGNSGNPGCLLMIKKVGETHEKAQVTNAPVAQSDLWATLAALMGFDTLDFGRAVFDYREDETRFRTTYSFDSYPDYPAVGKNYNVLVSWTYDTPVLKTNLKLDPQKIYPLFDSYYK